MADEEQEEVYVIEKIVKKKITKEGKVKYFLKWRDYPDSDNTWEMAEDLDCDELIQKFEEELSKNGDKVEEEMDDDDDVEEETELNTDADLKDATEDLDESGDPLSAKVGEGGGASPSPDEEPIRNEKSGLKGSESGFDKGYTVETIIGITPRKADKYAFLIKWKESSEPSLEDRQVCNRKCPQKIIKFYEKRLVWMK